MVSWNLTTIGSLVQRGDASLQTGPFGTALHASAYLAEGTPVVAVQNIGDNRITENGIPRVGADDAERLAKYRLQLHDILFARKGAVERRALVRHSQVGWIQGSDCIRLRVRSGVVDPAYVAFVLGAPATRSWLRSQAHGATMPSLNQEILGRLPLALPPIEEQRAIASVLGALDDKIELNRRMNETLEALARAIFTSWFVDFDAVRARAEGRQPIGMDAETAALFPSSLEDSPLGPIPSRWETIRLGSQIEVVRGLSYSGAGLTNAGGGLPLHNLNSIVAGGGYRTSGLKWFSGTYADRHIARAGDLIVANTDLTWAYEVIASPAIVPRRYGETGLFSHHLYRVRPRHDSNLTVRYLYLLLSTRRYHAAVAGFSNGTTVNMLPAAGLERPWVALPPGALVQRFDAMVAPMLERQEQLHSEGDLLASTRDALLPKLIRGEIRVASNG